MRRTGLLVGIICSVAVGAGACNRADDRAAQQEAAIEARDGGASGDEVTVTGCLTAAADGNAYALTAARTALTSGAMHSGTGETPTYTYELMGNTGELKEHVGRQVEVTGRVDPDRRDRENVDEKEKTELPETPSGDRNVTPAIETETEMRINVRRLEVRSVTETGRACVPSEGQQ